MAEVIQKRVEFDIPLLGKSAGVDIVAKVYSEEGVWKIGVKGSVVGVSGETKLVLDKVVPLEFASKVEADAAAASVVEKLLEGSVKRIMEGPCASYLGKNKTEERHLH